MTPTPREIKIFLSGLEHAMKCCDQSKRGIVAKRAIQKELTTLRLLYEVKNGTG
jgi:hypothetical protein